MRGNGEERAMSHQDGRDLPGFDESRLAAAVERLTPEQVDALPFGAIRLDADGVVRFYSKAEARLSGSADRARLGRGFFTEIAPCMDKPDYRGRIEAARVAGRLDLEFGWVGDFDNREKALRVRVQSTGMGDGGMWIFMQRG